MPQMGTFGGQADLIFLMTAISLALIVVVGLMLISLNQYYKKSRSRQIDSDEDSRNSMYATKQFRVSEGRSVASLG